MQTHWRDVHRRVWQLVEHFWAPNAAFGHGIEHAASAYASGVAIAEREAANPLVVGAGCYLMDSGLDLQNGRHNHIERSLDIARSVIDQITELRPVRDDIYLAIAHHEGDNPVPPSLPLEALIVRDADTLDRLGIVGIRMTLLYGLWIKRPFCHPEDPLCRDRNPELNGYSLDYVRYSFRLADALSTEPARVTGRQKVAEQQAFFEWVDSVSATATPPDYADAFAVLDEFAERSF